MRQHTIPDNAALVFIIGDLNFGDAIETDEVEGTFANNLQQAQARAHFESTFPCFTELCQGEATRMGNTCLSRLDHIYINAKLPTLARLCVFSGMVLTICLVARIIFHLRQRSTLALRLTAIAYHEFQNGYHLIRHSIIVANLQCSIFHLWLMTQSTCLIIAKHCFITWRKK
jgi:hypothetical protein